MRHCPGVPWPPSHSGTLGRLWVHLQKAMAGTGRTGRLYEVQLLVLVVAEKNYSVEVFRGWHKDMEGNDHKSVKKK